MSHSPQAAERGPVRRKRVTKSISPGENLPIRIHSKAIPCLAPGASRLYCYWKRLTPEVLEKWVGKLRDNPYEDIVLGRTTYNWAIDVLLPARQYYTCVPIHGRNGWPHYSEPVPCFNSPRAKLETDVLPISINRAPLLPSLGMGRLVCYWPMRLPRNVQPRRYVWVPPEWRKLTDNIRQSWARKLGADPGKPIVLGETSYYWLNDTLVPYGQNPCSIEYYGEGRYDDTESIEDEPIYDIPYEPVHCYSQSTRDAVQTGIPLSQAVEILQQQYSTPVDAVDPLGDLDDMGDLTYATISDAPRHRQETLV